MRPKQVGGTYKALVSAGEHLISRPNVVIHNAVRRSRLRQPIESACAIACTSKLLVAALVDADWRFIAVARAACVRDSRKRCTAYRCRGAAWRNERRRDDVSPRRPRQPEALQAGVP